MNTAIDDIPVINFSAAIIAGSQSEGCSEILGAIETIINEGRAVGITVKEVAIGPVEYKEVAPFASVEGLWASDNPQRQAELLDIASSVIAVKDPTQSRECFLYQGVIVTSRGRH